MSSSRYQTLTHSSVVFSNLLFFSLSFFLATASVCTSVASPSRTPHWNEQFEFQIIDAATQTLQLKVTDEGRLGLLLRFLLLFCSCNTFRSFFVNRYFAAQTLQLKVTDEGRCNSLGSLFFLSDHYLPRSLTFSSTVFVLSSAPRLPVPGLILISDITSNQSSLAHAIKHSLTHSLTDLFCPLFFLAPRLPVPGLNLISGVTSKLPVPGMGGNSDAPSLGVCSIDVASLRPYQEETIFLPLQDTTHGGLTLNLSYRPFTHPKADAGASLLLQTSVTKCENLPAGTYHVT
jgi:hypothetical protein